MLETGSPWIIAQIHGGVNAADASDPGRDGHDYIAGYHQVKREKGSTPKEKPLFLFCEIEKPDEQKRKDQCEIMDCMIRDQHRKA